MTNSVFNFSDDNPNVFDPSVFSGDSVPVQGQTDFGTQSEDMDAINRFMRTTKIVNNAAFPIKDDFIRWWDNLSDWSRMLSSDAYDDARTRMYKFQLANVTNEAQKANVVRVITTGVTTEEMQGKKKPPILSTGEVGSQIKKKSEGVAVAQSSSTAASSGKPVLRVGSTGEPVKQWQKIVGVSPLTGYYGDYTAKATIAWKGKNGLPTTGPDAGVVTEAAWAKALGIVGPSFAPGVPSEPAFAPPPTPSFAPTPAPATPRQASTTTRQPTTAPKTAPKAQPAKKASTATKTAKVAAASMFDFTKWPAVAQVLGVLTITGGAIAYAFHANKKL